MSESFASANPLDYCILKRGWLSSIGSMADGQLQMGLDRVYTIIHIFLSSICSALSGSSELDQI